MPTKSREIFQAQALARNIRRFRHIFNSNKNILSTLELRVIILLITNYRLEERRFYREGQAIACISLIGCF